MSVVSWEGWTDAGAAEWQGLCSALGAALPCPLSLGSAPSSGLQIAAEEHCSESTQRCLWTVGSLGVASVTSSSSQPPSQVCTSTPVV